MTRAFTSPRTARSIEATARQRQSLVTLGTLAAGLAHELNNPAAAAVRAADALEDACQQLLTSVSRLAAHQVSAEQFAALEMLRQEVTGSAAALDALALADLEDAVAEWLTRHGVGREWIIAPPLAAAGVDTGWCERAAAILDPAALEPGLEWAASTLSAAALLTEVKDSTRRISALVTAVKSYTQMDRASMQRLDVADGLESTLVMLGHMLGTGNAVEAMSGKGTLRLSTRASEDKVVIEVADTGSGMPPHVAAWTSHTASSQNVTTGPSTSIPSRATQFPGSRSRSAHLSADMTTPPRAPAREGVPWTVRRSPHGERRIMAPAERYSMKAIVRPGGH